MTTRTPSPSRFFVNNLTGVCEMHVTGSIHQGRLEKKVRAIFAALPAGTFTPAPRALWKHYIDCTARNDAYEIRFQVRDAKAVESALYPAARASPPFEGTQQSSSL